MQNSQLNHTTRQGRLAGLKTAAVLGLLVIVLMLAMACSGGSPPAPEPTTAPTATPEPAAVAAAPADAQPTPTETPEPTAAPTPAEPAATIAPAATETTAPPPTPTAAAASPTVEPTATPPPTPRATKTPEPCRFRKQVGDQTLPWVKEHHPQWPAFDFLDGSTEANAYGDIPPIFKQWHPSIWWKNAIGDNLLFPYYRDKELEEFGHANIESVGGKVDNATESFIANMGWAVMNHEEPRVCYWAWHYNRHDEDDKLEISFEATHTIVDTIPQELINRGISEIPERKPGDPGYDPDVKPGMVDMKKVKIHEDTIDLKNVAP